jgi:hypothetical protein
LVLMLEIGGGAIKTCKNYKSIAFPPASPQ